MKASFNRAFLKELSYIPLKTRLKLKSLFFLKFNRIHP